MEFEELANELILEIFEYFDSIHLYRAFCHLNSRFNNLLFLGIRISHINFRSLSQEELNNFCGKYFSTMITKVHSLCLSDGDETPELSILFLSYDFNFNEFINLRSLSLYSINDIDVINTILSQCHNLPQLTQFQMIDCCPIQQSIRHGPSGFFSSFTSNNDRQRRAYLINNIWSLPKLLRCKLNYCFENEISVVSHSIKHLNIENIPCDFNQLSSIFKCTPRLRHLHTTIKCVSEGEQLQICASSLISLRVSFKSSINLMEKLFRKVSNVCYLTIETSSIYLNGYEWEQILVKYFPQIKSFRLRMNMKFSDSIYSEREVDRLLNSFQTSYWVEEHKWFVRCDWKSYNTYSFGILYTIPYAFKQFFHLSQRHSKSTYSDAIDSLSFNYVEKLQYINGKNSLFDNSVLFSFRFSYLQYLQMSFPFNVNFWSIIPSLNNLISLDATLYDNLGYKQLQMLLDRAPYLYSLKLCILPGLKRKDLLQIKSKSIRRLEFIKESVIYDHYFNTTECSMLSQSLLGQQCEVLIIGIEKRENIFQLIKSMTNLRILNYKCQKESSLTNDELVRWIKTNQSPFILSFIRYINQISTFHYWIR